MMGPQWLCDCNESGGAETLAKAGGDAAKHFLGHGEAGIFPHAVSVYQERGDWAYSITTGPEADKAMKVAHPMMQVSSVLTTLTAEAQAATKYFEAFTAALTGTGYNSAPYTHTFTLPSPAESPLTSEQIAFRDAQNAVSYMYTEAVRKTQYIDWGKSRGLVSGA